MPTRRPTVLLCGSAPPGGAAVLRALLAQRARVFVHAAVGARPAARAGAVAVRGDLGGAESSRRWIEAAWAAAKAVDAVIICPALSTVAVRDAENDFQAGAAALRATFFLAQQAGARLQRARRGQLIIAIADQRAAGAAGRVLREGLICMAEGLGKALGDRVAVAAVVATPRSGGRAAPAALAAAVAALIAQPAGAPYTIVHVGG